MLLIALLFLCTIPGASSVSLAMTRCFALCIEFAAEFAPCMSRPAAVFKIKPVWCGVALNIEFNGTIRISMVGSRPQSTIQISD